MNTVEITLLRHQSRIEEIVAETMRETFKTYFNIDIAKASSESRGGIPDGIFCQTVIRDEENSGSVTVSFEKPFLQELARIVYPAEEASKQESFEACAVEIGNIVSARIKTYLNEHGYNLAIEIPSIVHDADVGPQDIKVSFFIDRQRLFVDIGFNHGANNNSYDQIEG